MRRERMAARGRRGTHGMVEMVREQVDALTRAMGDLTLSVDDMKFKVQASMDGVQAKTAKLAAEVGGLGRMVKAMASDVDDHEKRLTRLEKRGGKS